MQRPISQQMLELTDSREGMSTREIVNAIWPEINNEKGKERSTKLQHLLSKARSVMVIHEAQGRVTQDGYAYGNYNRARSIVWRITPAGREWLVENDPDKIAARRALVQSEADEKTNRKEVCDRLLGEARQLYGRGTSPATRRQVSRLLRAEGCTLQAIADIFGVTRELIRIDCRGLTDEHKLTDEERAEILAS